MADMLIVRVYLLFLWIVLYPNALIYLIGLITRIPRRRENTSSCFTTTNESRVEVTRASGGVIDAPTATLTGRPLSPVLPSHSRFVFCGFIPSAAPATLARCW
jgi:hypothetical protein